MNNVDKTTSNDEVLEANDLDNDSTNEGDAETGEKPVERTYTQSELDAEIERTRKERDRRWKERFKNATKGDEEGSEDGQEGGQEDHKEKVVTSDDATLARLEARGIIDPDIQSYITSEAKRLQKSPIELLGDGYYQAKIEEKKKEKEKSAATPSPNSRTGSNNKAEDVNYWVQQAEKGISAPTAEMRKKVRLKLAGR